MVKTVQQRLDQKLTGAEPTYNPESFYEGFDLIKFYNWYNYNCDHTDAKKYLVEAATTNKKYQQFAPAVARLTTGEINLTAAWIARMETKGMKLNRNQQEFLTDYMRSTVEITAGRAEQQSARPTISVAERTEIKAGEIIGELEGLIDDVIRSEYQLTVDVYQKMVDLGVKGAHTKFIIKHFKPHHKELVSMMNKKHDPDLKEGYKTLKLKQARTLIALYQSIITNGEVIAGNAKRARKGKAKKTRPATKQIGKLQYLDKFDKLKLVSIQPERLVGAKVAFIFNTTNNQLSMYVAADAEGLQVARSSLKNFKPTSVSKRVGDGEKLKALESALKTEAVELFEQTKSTIKPASGRINNKMIILKVF